MKTAVFVEGYTEAAFVKALVAELAGHHHVAFVEETFFGGTFIIKYSDAITSQRHEFLIANCCSDGKVASAIRDRYDKLVAAGYTSILGLRDIYPLPSSQLPTVVAAIAKYMPVGTAPVLIVIAIAEIEAWFIEEESHFLNIDPNLTAQRIKSDTGYDILSGAGESITHPATFLHTIYSLVGLAYKKKQNQIARTVNALDMTNLYLNSRQRSMSLDRFISALEKSLI